MQLEFNRAYVFLGCKIFWLIFIVHIVRFYQESLSLFEKVVNREIGHKTGIEVIKNAFSPSTLHLDRARALLFELVKNQESISLGKRIQVWQIVDGEREFNDLSESSSASITYAILDGLEC